MEVSTTLNKGVDIRLKYAVHSAFIIAFILGIVSLSGPADAKPGLVLCLNTASDVVCHQRGASLDIIYGIENTDRPGTNVVFDHASILNDAKLQYSLYAADSVDADFYPERTEHLLAGNP